MTEHLYVVTGASGNVGKIEGAEVRVGSLEDAAFLTKAFEGATAVFTMIPPNNTASAPLGANIGRVDVRMPSQSKQLRASPPGLGEGETPNKVKAPASHNG
jgi:uncharacterized protein YbjT (DUF2867 family)